ncbi:MAG TPA: ribonuclease T2 [Acidobacteriaceae bacterium]|nr:ribonuclease T2 [Acidobacteriaceae bacterium]
MLGRSLLTLSVLVLLLASGCQQPRRFPAGRMSRARVAIADAANVPAAKGNFDYYLFTLSWSPEYCHGHPKAQQCNGAHSGFVVHGLWPQFNNGRWPSACSSAPGLSNPSSMLDIMPDPRLIQHEWTTHGTCSGLTSKQYFSVIRKAYESIRIPSSLVSPSHTITRSAGRIKQMFTDANPGMSPDDIAVDCHNRYLSAVEFCLGKDLQPIACRAVRDCTALSVRIPAAQ